MYIYIYIYVGNKEYWNIQVLHVHKYDTCAWTPNSNSARPVYASLGFYLAPGDPDIQISRLLAARPGQSTLV